eukprot:Lithocolla_globosa_v1_NODE_805_length_3253_cov_31.566604.p3 type:complete len:156 gc:universal NODE_805_length_3253_cov_31.566604:2474-2941(+)
MLPKMLLAVSRPWSTLQASWFQPVTWIPMIPMSLPSVSCWLLPARSKLPPVSWLTCRLQNDPGKPMKTWRLKNRFWKLLKLSLPPLLLWCVPPLLLSERSLPKVAALLSRARKLITQMEHGRMVWYPLPNTWPWQLVNCVILLIQLYKEVPIVNV